jgi:hypothetical protein
MMVWNTNVPFKGRIQKRKTHDLQIIIFGLQRAAGPYRRARRRHKVSLLNQSALSYARRHFVSPSAFDKATRWPPGMSSTSFPSLSRATRR